MDSRYFPEQVEREAQAYWAEHRTFEVDEDPEREKFYCLCMFPYPSGRLHMGHVRNYTIGDVIGRYHRMTGKNVLQPMGWDAFGLPAENAAIDAGVPPASWTYQNIEYMKQQLMRLGFGYDWTRELATCHPDYYRWEQWLFTRLFEKGIAYKEMAEVNWDPIDQTVLANEQVIDGRGWRSGALVERRKIPHWFLRITDYADELLAELDRMDGWPDAVKTMQRNWIGRSEGVEIDFDLADGGEPLRVFTTRPDTLFGATFMAVAAEHPLALGVAESNDEVARFVETCRTRGTSEAELETAEKLGVPLGIEAVNPINGERLPVWAANFVLMSYGTGAIMSVPAHDERDHEFATKYGLPIIQVIAPSDDTEVDTTRAAWTSKESMVTVNSGDLSGLDFEAAFDAFASRLEAACKGERRVNYRLRDWGISRQRYWGAPVPIINCEACGAVPVPDDQLPVRLPEDVEMGGGGSPLAKLADFVETTCPRCGASAKRETDTFDTFMESSWYFARYACPGASEAMVDERANYWMPVDQYIGGIEHAILHLLYARFYQKLMRDAGLTSVGEPFANLLTQGMVLKETFFRTREDGQPSYFSPAEVDVEHDDKGKVVGARLREDGEPVEVGGVEKMSKSKNNGVDPEEMIARYGADTMRLYMMSTSPPDYTLEWQDTAVAGSARLLREIWRMVAAHVEAGTVEAGDPGQLDEAQAGIRRLVHRTIAKVGDDIGRRYKFNTAIAAVIELKNALGRWEDASPAGRAVRQEALDAVVLMLAPVVPHMCHVLWRELGHGEAVVDAPWPRADESAMVQDTVELVVQVNGKLRGHVSVSAGADRGAIESAAFDNENVRRFVEGKEVKRTIVVPGKLVNIVVAA